MFIEIYHSALTNRAPRRIKWGSWMHPTRPPGEVASLSNRPSPPGSPPSPASNSRPLRWLRAREATAQKRPRMGPLRGVRHRHRGALREGAAKLTEDDRARWGKFRRWTFPHAFEIRRFPCRTSPKGRRQRRRYPGAERWPRHPPIPVVLRLDPRNLGVRVGPQVRTTVAAFGPGPPT